jgi:hypothetical protein
MTKKYNVTFEQMSAQLDTNGNIKIDANGDPLQSIRIKQPHKQKRRMLDEMEQLSDLYHTAPRFFPIESYQVGNDPKEYTIKQMIKDFDKRLKGWKTDQTKDLYRSFVDRHNFILGEIHLGAHIDLIELIDNDTTLIMRSGLFDFGC